MHPESIEQWQHQHTFNVNKEHIERKTFTVVVITFVTMIAEIVFGLITNSMALFADGLHMGTHAFALGLSLVAYVLARRNAKNSNFTFGTWKIEILGAYSSSLVLGFVAIFMVYASVGRFRHPLPIQYSQAILVAALGLAINLICTIVLGFGSGHHAHEHSHEGHPPHTHDEHEDLNLKSAYLHVIADAFTSVLAIVALLGAKYLSIIWLDPLMGIVGAALITRWAVLLLRDSARILLDYKSGLPISAEIKNRIESDGDSRISDLHVWRVADNNYACIVSLVTGSSNSIGDYKKRLINIRELAHITIEKNEYETT